MNSDDPSVSALQSRAYNALNTYFTAHEDEIVQIEVLPPAFPPPDGISMQDGANLGVPKKILALAFVEARRIFFASIKDDAQNRVALEATRVMLLFDPQHLTAANFRKRRILHHKASELAFATMLKREVAFLDTILTSPLHRQSKSPTLWHHRSWLLSYILPPKLHDPSSAKLASFVKAELEAVCKSGERHPKNYYAWQYARTLFSHLYSPSPSIPGPYTELVLECINRVKDWCCTHPSDISGWSFLAFLLRRFGTLEQRRLIVHQVIEYAIHVRLSNESLWMFVRMIVADNTLGDEGLVIMRILSDWRGRDTDGEDNVIRGQIEQTVSWVERWGPSAKELSS